MINPILSCKTTIVSFFILLASRSWSSWPHGPVCGEILVIFGYFTFAIINFVDGIESKIIQNSNKDIKSSQIGELILKGLRKENEVAYIRYASVYRKFNGVKDFVSTLESLKGNSKNELASIL